MEKLRRWIASGGFWSMSDQAVVSLGNFLLTVTLARHLPKPEYGAYVVTLGAFLVANAFHSGLVAYPASVLGAHVPEPEISRFGANAVLVTYAFALPIATVLGLATWMLSRNLELCLFVVGAMFFWQTHETLRRCLMSQLRHRAAVFGDFVGYIGQVVLLFVLIHERTDVSARTGFMAIMLASLAGAIVHAVMLRLRSPQFATAVELGRESIRLGRWSLFSVLGYWGTVSLLPWALALRDLAEVANYQVMMNVVQIANPVMFSVSNLVIPSVAHEIRKVDGDRSARKITFIHMLQGLALLAPIFLVIILFPRFIMQSLYGHTANYTGSEEILRVLVIGGLATYTGHILASYFLGRKDVEIVGRSQIGASATAIICAAFLIPLWGVAGAALSFVAMGVSRNVLLIVALRRHGKGSIQTPEPLDRDQYSELSPAPPGEEF